MAQVLRGRPLTLYHFHAIVHAGRVQRAWVASVARRREDEAVAQATAAEQLILRLARARASEFRTRRFASLITRSIRSFVHRRMAVAASLHGWLSKEVSSSSPAPPGWRWRRRYFWVAHGKLLYDSVRSSQSWQEPSAQAGLISELSGARCIQGSVVCLSFARHNGFTTLRLRANDAAEAEDWRRGLLWLAQMV